MGRLLTSAEPDGAGAAAEASPEGAAGAAAAEAVALAAAFSVAAGASGFALGDEPELLGLLHATNESEAAIATGIHRLVCKDCPLPRRDCGRRFEDDMRCA